MMAKERMAPANTVRRGFFMALTKSQSEYLEKHLYVENLQNGSNEECFVSKLRDNDDGQRSKEPMEEVVI